MTDAQAASAVPPIPPVRFRRLVGAVDPALYDNSSAQPVFPDVSSSAYASVFDFGCGCGRVARQLIQQTPRPARYVGVDRHPDMVAWCTEHLAPAAPGFEFRHHDAYHASYNPTGNREATRLPAGDASVTLFIAHSVFTHLFEEQIEFYLREIARVLTADGVAMTTWFLFDKRDFPMMQEFQNALFINRVDPENAVIVDRDWLVRQFAGAGLVATGIVAPAIRGFQWQIALQRVAPGRVAATFPPDLGPVGLARPPISEWG